MENIDHYVEDKNIKISKDSIVGGELIKAGTKMSVILKQGCYSGGNPPIFNCYQK